MSVRSINLTVEEAYEKYNERNHPLSKNDFHAYMDSLDISFRKEGEVKFKAINLSSLAGAYGKPFLPDPDKESCPLEGLFKSYCRAFGGLKEHEIECIVSLVKRFSDRSNLMQLTDNFFVGYKMEGLGEEFDLLRINKNSVVDIELKRKKEEGGVRKQLKRKAYYLGFIEGKKCHCFSYLQEENILYKLDESKDLVEASFEDLCDLLMAENEKIESIDALFRPSNYFVSPFNATERFMEGKYCLTPQQLNIKGDIMKAVGRNNAEFLALTGEAGTGKTLLAYDIAKELMSEGKKVLIIHCANLNSGQYVLKEEHSWNIFAIKEIHSESTEADRTDLSKYDVIVIDEAQRIYPWQFDFICDEIKAYKLKCLFSYDEKQCLSNREMYQDISSKIQRMLNNNPFELTDKIRINRAISLFIDSLFDNRKGINSEDYSCIDLCYCTSVREVRQLSNFLDGHNIDDSKSVKDWIIPRYTPGHSSYPPIPYEAYGVGNDSAHSIIGQEYDKVVAVIDETFHYDEEGKLTGGKGYDYYSQSRMLYQIMTRARQRLYVIILNNPPMLERCLKILERSSK